MRKQFNNGVWRSLVARPLWERKAVGSNPATPTSGNPAMLRKNQHCRIFIFIYLLCFVCAFAGWFAYVQAHLNLAYLLICGFLYRVFEAG